jgi:hypothetical protein
MRPQLNRKFWFEELIAWLFKLYPVLLFFLGWINANESFLVLIVSYLAFAIRLQCWMAFNFFKEYKERVWLPYPNRIAYKISGAFEYILGFFLVFSIWMFLYLIFFGLFYDAVDRQNYGIETGLFYGEKGDALRHILLINGFYYTIREFFLLRKQIIQARHKSANLIQSMLLNINIEHFDKWSTFPLIWFMLSMFIFIFLCTARAFQTAIVFYFFFDLVFTFLKRLEARKQNQVG